jgi:tetratricopeptide (TPR) repeat protein
VKALALGALAVCLFSSALARAQGSATDRALAEVLFRDARDLMEAGKTTEACAKFQESYRLDAALGTLLNLAVCHEKAGQLASAWARYGEAVAVARQKNDAERLAFAEDGSRRLDGRFATLRIALTHVASIPDLRISFDGRALGRASVDSPIPIDPGPHQVTIEAEGHEPWTQSFNVATDASTVPLEVPPLRRKAAPPTTAPSPTPSPSTEDAESGNAQRIWGLGLGAAGIVGLGVAAGFGVHAINAKNERDEICSDGLCPSQEGIDAHQSADSAATVANIAAATGGVLLATGVVLYFTAPRGASQARQRRHSVAFSPGGVVWRGTWD